MVSTSVTFGHTAGPAKAAATGGVGAGDTGAGDESGTGLSLTTVGPEQLGLTASATPGFTIDYARGGQTLGHATTASPDVAITRTRRDEPFGHTAAAPPGADLAFHRDIQLGHMGAASVDLTTATTSQRIVHRVGLNGVFDIGATEIAGVFTDHDEIDGLVEREDL